MTYPLDEERLADFLAGRLSAEASSEVERALAASEAWQDVVIVARAMEREEEGFSPTWVPAGERLARARAKGMRAPAAVRAVFRIVHDALSEVAAGAWFPVAAPAVRGQAEGPVALWTTTVPSGAGPALVLELERAGEGAVVGAATATEEAGLSVALVRDGSLVSMQPIGTETVDLGCVGPGTYRVELRRGGAVLGATDMELSA